MPLTDASTSKPDGRRMRSDRSRQLIIESMLELIKLGNLVPTAQQVADHANVGIRSVFRHFEDMESIFETANELCHKEYRGLFMGGDRSGSLQERILHATECHANAYETIKKAIWHTSINYAKISMNGYRNSRLFPTTNVRLLMASPPLKCGTV